MDRLNQCAFDASDFAHPSVKALTPYQPGKAITTMTQQPDARPIIKLASNENPMGPSPAVLRAIQAAGPALSYYPDADGTALKQAIAAFNHVDRQQVTLGNGSENIVELLIRGFCQPGESIVVSNYAFMAYAIIAKGLNVDVTQVPANNYGHDLPAMRAAITDKTKLVFIVNPNNPTGTYIPHTALTEFLAEVPKNVIVVVDEAYFEFMGTVPDYQSMLPQIANYPNVVVTRTFSKAYGLAGLRLGYSVSHPSVANIINRVRQPFNVNSLSLVAGEAALADQAYLEKGLAVNREGLKILSQTLDRLQLSYQPSSANFILVDLGQSSLPIYNALLKAGIITRMMGPYQLPNHLRISIGTQQQMSIFSDTFETVMTSQEHHYESTL